MCPTLSFSFFTDPLGSSRISEYFGFQKNSLLGEKFSFIFTTFKLLSKTTTSKVFFTKNECSPNLVFKKIPFSLNFIAPNVLSKKLFKWIISQSIEALEFKFLSTKPLYMNRLEYQKGV